MGETKVNIFFLFITYSKKFHLFTFFLFFSFIRTTPARTKPEFMEIGLVEEEIVFIFLKNISKRTLCSFFIYKDDTDLAKLDFMVRKDLFFFKLRTLKRDVYFLFFSFIGIMAWTFTNELVGGKTFPLLQLRTFLIMFFFLFETLFSFFLYLKTFLNECFFAFFRL